MNDWIKKLANEDSLTAEEVARLDEALKAQDAAGLQSMVASLPRFEAPASIVGNFEKSLRRRGVMRLASGFGAFAAASMAMFFALNSQEAAQPVTEGPSADSLYDWHNEAVATSVLPGDGAGMAAFSQVARNGESQRP